MPQWLQIMLAVAAGIGTPFGLIAGGMATYRSARATSQKSVAEIQRGMIDDLRIQQDRDRTDSNARVTALEASDKEKGEQISSLRAQLHAVTEDRDDVVAYLKTLWRWVVSGAKPPPPPIPDHLHDVLPPSDYVWPTPTQTFDDTTD